MGMAMRDDSSSYDNDNDNDNGNDSDNMCCDGHLRCKIYTLKKRILELEQ